MSLVNPIKMRREAILKENFAKHLTSLRKERNLSQEELVIALKAASDNEIDITRSALASYENQKSLPRLDVFSAIARFFEVSMDYMLETETNAPKPAAEPLAEEVKMLRQANRQLNIRLTELSQEFENLKRDREFYKNEWEQAIRQTDNPANETQADFLRRMYNYPYWRNQFRKLLTEVEFDIFYSVQNDQTKAQLAERLELDPEEVVRIFNEARGKILKYFNT